MTTQERIDKLVEWLATSFAVGDKTMSKDDEYDDAGTTLRAEIRECLQAAAKEKIVLGEDGVVREALATFAAPWGQGFELASGDDLVTDSDTVADVICDHYDNVIMAAREAAPAP
jgi:hypothetical protein